MTRSSLQPKVQNQFDKYFWRVTVLIYKNVSSSLLTFIQRESRASIITCTPDPFYQRSLNEHVCK